MNYAKKILLMISKHDSATIFRAVSGSTSPVNL